ncbi:uncharacterized protein [Narcine bancroftii]|uniref:uncharacterized protein isoform X1 n=1 Tax=Narcine bancroftii TaxID=1343680 RepID=UPI003831A805
MHIDIVGPLPISRDARYLLTRWPEVVKHLWKHVWAALANTLGTQLHHTTAYHLQANRLVERFHRHVKTALMARLTGPNWADELPLFLLGIHTTLKEDLEASSAKLVYSMPLVIPDKFIARSKDMGDLPAATLSYLHECLGTAQGPSPRQNLHTQKLYRLWTRICTMQGTSVTPPTALQRAIPCHQSYQQFWGWRLPEAYSAGRQRKWPLNAVIEQMTRDDRSVTISHNIRD